jgi:hypothetical protein
VVDFPRIESVGLFWGGLEIVLATDETPIKHRFRKDGLIRKACSKQERKAERSLEPRWGNRKITTDEERMDMDREKTADGGWPKTSCAGKGQRLICCHDVTA